MTLSAIFSALQRAALVLFCVAGIGLSWLAYADFAKVEAIQTGDASVVERIRVEGAASPDAMKALARRSILQGTESPDFAIAQLRQSIALNPGQADAAAFLAYAEALKAGGANEAANRDLRESFSACLLCDEALTKWRLEFVLTYWRDIDEDNRISAFKGAEFLRRWHLEHVYVDEIRDRAEARGIPFSEYQGRVVRPVRPSEGQRPAP